MAAAALRQGEFALIAVVADRVVLSDADFSCAWESNLRSAAHEEVRSLAPASLEALRLRFEHALDDRRRSAPSFAVAEVLYAYGARADDGSPDDRAAGRDMIVRFLGLLGSDVEIVVKPRSG